MARYLKGRRARRAQSAGALSVLALLLVLGFQAVSGLFTSDDIMVQGRCTATSPKPLPAQ